MRKVAQLPVIYTMCLTLRSALLEVHKQVLKQRDEFYQESERLRQSATPRPDWEKCADVIPGGEDTRAIVIMPSETRNDAESRERLAPYLNPKYG